MDQPATLFNTDQYETQAPIRVPVNETGMTTEELARDTADRFGKNENLIYAVLIIVGITLVGIVLAGYALIVDQEHFNNELYRDKDYTHTLTTEKFVNSQPSTPENPLGNLK